MTARRGRPDLGALTVTETLAKESIQNGSTAWAAREVLLRARAVATVLAHLAASDGEADAALLESLSRLADRFAFFAAIAMERSEVAA